VWDLTLGSFQSAVRYGFGFVSAGGVAGAGSAGGASAGFAGSVAGAGVAGGGVVVGSLHPNIGKLRPARATNVNNFFIALVLVKCVLLMI
jgi:hypothetical protein